MVSQLELSARAALCRQLAEREPTNRVLWTDEAENWSRLSNEKLRGEPQQNSIYPTLASLRARSARLSANLGVARAREKEPRMHGPPSGDTQQNAYAVTLVPSRSRPIQF